MHPFCQTGTTITKQRWWATTPRYHITPMTHRVVGWVHDCHVTTLEESTILLKVKWLRLLIMCLELKKSFGWELKHFTNPEEVYLPFTEELKITMDGYMNAWETTKMYFSDGTLSEKTFMRQNSFQVILLLLPLLLSV